MTQNFLIYYLAALHFENIGPIKMTRWLSHFENIQQLFNATQSHLQHIGLTEKEIHAVKNPNWKLAEKDLAWLQQSNCEILTRNDERYPILLKEIPDAPLVLFIRGNVDLLMRPQIALVGSRNPTSAARETATDFAYALAKAGLVITSGLALGIDAAAHRGALKASLPTIAVTGAGLKYIYPKSHHHLADEISELGAIVSEFSPHTMPIAKNFPRRNRIISGLSMGVAVIEAALRSGSLITARLAAEQGREVFAMPGSIHNPLVKGCHELIRQGAKLIETAADILSELVPLWDVTLFQKEQNAAKTKDKIEQKYSNILAHIDYGMTPLDTIILRSGLTAGEVSSMLLTLELDGLVDNVPGGFIRTT